MALQRNLKALGTFGYQTITRRNPVYIQYMPRTLALRAGRPREVPALRPPARAAASARWRRWRAMYNGRVATFGVSTHLYHHQRLDPRPPARDRGARVRDGRAVRRRGRTSTTTTRRRSRTCSSGSARPGSSVARVLVGGRRCRGRHAVGARARRRAAGAAFVGAPRDSAWRRWSCRSGPPREGGPPASKRWRTLARPLGDHHRGGFAVGLDDADRVARALRRHGQRARRSADRHLPRLRPRARERPATSSTPSRPRRHVTTSRRRPTTTSCRSTARSTGPRRSRRAEDRLRRDARARRRRPRRPRDALKKAQQARRRIEKMLRCDARRRNARSARPAVLPIC